MTIDFGDLTHSGSAYGHIGRVALNIGRWVFRPECVSPEMMGEDLMVRVLFLIENVPYKIDTRVRREGSALQEAGASICIICPADGGKLGYHEENNAHIYQYYKISIGEGFASHILEYVSSLISMTSLTLYICFRRGFDVIHVANPPDLLWLVAAPYKLFGKRFIYDQHDLVPELFDVRFGDRLKVVSWVMRALERASYRLADHVITTTASFRRIAIERGGQREEDVTIVRNGPRLSVDFPPVDPDPEVRGLGHVVVGYLGIMNPQDSLENFLEMARIIRNDRNRTDIGFVMVGGGGSFERLKRMRDGMGLTDAVRMTGTIPWNDVLSTMAASDICVQPDSPNVFNDKLAMNKLMEYMALGKAAVAFDMPETRISGSDNVVYAKGDSTAALADAVLALADDEGRRKTLGESARRRIETVLCWEQQSKQLCNVYNKLFPGRLQV